MPTYQYQCKNCAHSFEAVESIKSEPQRKCPSCQDGTIERVVGPVVFHLKGDGWAKDGYSKPNKK